MTLLIKVVALSNILSSSMFIPFGVMHLTYSTCHFVYTSHSVALFKSFASGILFSNRHTLSIMWQPQYKRSEHAVLVQRHRVLLLEFDILNVFQSLCLKLTSCTI